MTGGPVIIGILALSWVWWHVTRWFASLFGWANPADWAVASVTLLSSPATAIVLFLLLRGRRQV